jgi:hypothetical protein
MKRLVVEGVAQIVMAAIVAAVAGFTALITMLPIGGAAFGMAPEAHINLVGGLMCPAGSTVVFEEGGQVVTNSGNGPSYGTAISLECEDANGVRTVLAPDVAVGPFFGAIGLVLGGYFLVCFGPLFLIGLLFGGVLTHKLVGSFMKKPPTAGQPAPPIQPTVL